MCLFAISVPGEPKKVKVEAINSTSIFVEWRPPEARKQNGIIRGYFVYYVAVDENDVKLRNEQERSFDTTDGNRNEAVITGLEPDTRYHIQVAGYTRKGDGARSKIRVVSTTGAGMISDSVAAISVNYQVEDIFHKVGSKYRVICITRLIQKM